MPTIPGGYRAIDKLREAVEDTLAMTQRCCVTRTALITVHICSSFQGNEQQHVIVAGPEV